jgi:hypothetical protein
MFVGLIISILIQDQIYNEIFSYTTKQLIFFKKFSVGFADANLQLMHFADSNL